MYILMHSFMQDDKIKRKKESTIQRTLSLKVLYVALRCHLDDFIRASSLVYLIVFVSFKGRPTASYSPTSEELYCCLATVTNVSISRVSSHVPFFVTVFYSRVEHYPRVHPIFTLFFSIILIIDPFV